MDINKRFNEHDFIRAGMLATLDKIEQQFQKIDKRFDLTIRRMVKAETPLEANEKRMQALDARMVKAEIRFEANEKRMQALDARMEAFDKKLQRSIQDQMEFSRTQSKINEFFLKEINKRMATGITRPPAESVKRLRYK